RSSRSCSTMRDSWVRYLRRLATTCLASGSVAAWSAMCYAQVAADSASDPVYADGWQDGDNGGFGFTPWDFSGSQDTNPPTQAAIHGVDSSSMFNNIGTSWRMALNPGGLPRAGRGFSPLQVGQTLRIILDNPTDYQFFKGYIIRFTS